MECDLMIWNRRSLHHGEDYISFITELCNCFVNNCSLFKTFQLEKRLEVI